MFPLPQDALPLPPRPDLDQYRKLAKDLVKACRSGDRFAVRTWAADWVRNLIELHGQAITPGLPVRVNELVAGVEEFARKRLEARDSSGRGCALADAQFVIARAQGFESWSRLARQIEALSHGESAESQFETAADAIVQGDVERLCRLLSAEPGLVRSRSTRRHGATLLHYVAANGVEGYRQRTPPNAVEMTRLLLDAGADVDAEADIYGGGATTLGLVATSGHPRRAGVQLDLLKLLLDHGARVNGAGTAGQPDSTIKACLANGHGEAAEFLAGRGVRLDLEEAAGVGRLAVVESFFGRDGSLKPDASGEQLQEGFLWACEYGHNSVVEYLIDRGASLTDLGKFGQTGMHCAVIGGQLETVRLLLGRKAPLEARNRYGGTVLGQALWSAVHGDGRIDYLPPIEMLLAAGAEIELGSLAWLEEQEGSGATERCAEVLRRRGAVG